MKSLFLLLVGAYLSGSVPYGKIVACAYGTDIQKRGSGNIGFANVRRILGWKAGILTLICDVAKGLIPALVTTNLLNVQLGFVVGFVAVVGHIYPVWLRFHGGKGIATGLGLVIAIEPRAAIIGVFTYIMGLIITKKSSLASLAGVLTVAISGILIDPRLWYMYVVLTITAFWTLRDNLRGKVPNYDI